MLDLSAMTSDFAFNDGDSNFLHPLLQVSLQEVKTQEDTRRNAHRNNVN